MAEISVIVPIYNGEKWIRECLEMIITQTFKDFELIIIDDGSTDDSNQICKEYARTDDRIKLITKKNGGTWAARNRGIDESSGKYIIFLDCDDWYENTLFEKMYENIKESDVDLVISGQTNIFVNKNGEIVRRTTVLPKELYFKTNDEILENYIHLRKEAIGDTLWNKIYKAEIIKKYNLKFENYKRGEDTIFNANYYQHIDKCRVISEALYNYRIENENPVWLKYSDNYLDIVRSENDTIVGKLKEWGKYNNDAREYQATHFTYRIIEYFYKITYSKNFLSLGNKIEQRSTLRSKCQAILNLLDNEEVGKNLNDSKLVGKFHKLLIMFMKSRNVEMILFLVWIKLKYNNAKGV